jgi:hypothetical protein
MRGFAKNTIVGKIQIIKNSEAGALAEELELAARSW